MSRWRGFVPLRDRGFRLLFSGQLASNVGDACYAVALPWYVLTAHGGALLLGTVLAAYGIPRTVVVAIGGQASDRWHPWTAMMVADVVRAGALVAFAVVARSGPPDAAAVIPIAIVLGAGEGLFLPASFSITPELLRGDELQAGNALVSAGTELAGLVGPAIGGVLVSFVGPASAFGLDAVSFVVSATSLAGIRAVGHTGRPVVAVSLAGEATAGDGDGDPAPGRAGELSVLHLLRRERVLQVIVVVTLAANLGLGAVSEVALPVLVRGPLAAGARGYGALLAAFAIGALVGTFLVGHLRQLSRPAVVGSVAFVVSAISLALVPYLGGVVGAGVLLTIFGGCNGFGNVLMVTTFQRWAPPEILGRLMGLLLLASFGIYPVSVGLGGVVVHALGPAPVFLAASAILGLAVLGGLSQPSWRRFGSTASEEDAVLSAAGAPPS